MIYPRGYHRGVNRILPANYRYVVSSSSPTLALTLDEVKSYLRLPTSETDEDALLTRMINAAVSCFESYTHRVLFRKTFKTYRDSFETLQFVLKKSDYVSLTSFQYLKNSILTDVPADMYQIVDTQPYARIVLRDQQFWPADVDVQKESIEITFVAGLADELGAYPDEIAIALLQLVAFLYENRGDCCVSLDNVSKLPQGAVGVFNKYKIMYLVAENYQESFTDDYIL